MNRHIHTFATPSYVLLSLRGRQKKQKIPHFSAPDTEERNISTETSKDQEEEQTSENGSESENVRLHFSGADVNTACMQSHIQTRQTGFTIMTLWR